MASQTVGNAYCNAAAHVTVVSANRGSFGVAYMGALDRSRWLAVAALGHGRE